MSEIVYDLGFHRVLCCDLVYLLAVALSMLL